MISKLSSLSIYPSIFYPVIIPTFIIEHCSSLLFINAGVPHGSVINFQDFFLLWFIVIFILKNAYLTLNIQLKEC